MQTLDDGPVLCLLSIASFAPSDGDDENEWSFLKAEKEVV